MNNNDLKALNDEVSKVYGLKSRIAERANVSYTLVAYVLKGQRKNDDILLLAAQMLEDHRKQEALKNKEVHKHIQRAIR